MQDFTEDAREFEKWNMNKTQGYLINSYNWLVSLNQKNMV